MSYGSRSFFASVGDWLGGLGVALRAALSTPLESGRADDPGEKTVDPDFDSWLHGDPMVTRDPASRYHHGSPGYLTRNGLGSLEIGAADD
jgi:hypothetical protein